MTLIAADPLQRPARTGDGARTADLHGVLQVAVSTSWVAIATSDGGRFHACRYPAQPCDTAHKYDPRTHDHVVFVRKNRFFEVPLSVGGTALSAAELQVCVCD